MITVPHELKGVRLQDFLERTWPEVDRVFLRQLVDQEAVTVNRMECHGRRRLGPGDMVTVTLPDGVESMADAPQRSPASAAPGAEAEQPACLAEGDYAAIYLKPAGIPSAPDRSGKRPGLLGAVQALRPDDDLRLAHRLDQWTSGCQAFAKGLDGARLLDAAFRERTVRKSYVALVEGEVSRKVIEIERSLGPDPRRPGKVMAVTTGAKKSRTAHSSVEVLERFRGYTLLTVRPTTGRSHQIRVHLKSIGHPIVGDTDYGSRGALCMSHFKRGYKLRQGLVERPLLARMFLHAERLEFPAFADESAGLSAAAPWSIDLEQAIQKLRRFASRQEHSACD